MVAFRLSSRLAAFEGMVRDLARNVIRPLALEADRTHSYPGSFYDSLAAMGYSGGQVPEEFGGEAAAGEPAAGNESPRKPSSSNRLMVLGSEWLAYGDPSVILNIPGPGLGGPPVQITGTPEQKRRFFAPFKPGQPVAWGAYALTEPHCGSDAKAIRTRCVKDGDHYILNGRKTYCSNGARAVWTVVFATLDPEGGRAAQRAFVVYKGTPGFSVGKIESKLGLRACETAELVFEDCRVPAENLLGGEEYYQRSGGTSFKTAMKTFDKSRPMVAAMAVGIARAAYDELCAFVSDAHCGGTPVLQNSNLRITLATMRRKIEAARLLCLRAAWMADHGQPNSKEASMSKAYAPQVGQWVCSEALRIMGGHGAQRARFVEKLYRDVKVFDIFEGTGQIQRLVVARRLMPNIRIQ